MSGRLSVEAQQAPAHGKARSPSLRVRRASHSDVPAVAAAVAALLVELGGTPPEPQAVQATARALIEDESLGALLVAEDDGGLVGVLGTSWQLAMHAPGRYALIQDLWVHPAWRSRAIGAALIEGLAGVMRQQEITRIEVGLPKAGFAALAATEAFYRANGFVTLGPRMRKVIE